MKLPEKIKGRNRIRDGAIVLYFKRDAISYCQLAEMFKLTERRILQILSKNHAFIKRDKEWEKEKRINRLAERLRTSPPTRKDELDILGELRKEIDGDTKIIQGGESKVVVIYPKEYKRPEQDQRRESNRNHVETIPGGVPRD